MMLNYHAGTLDAIGDEQNPHQVGNKVREGRPEKEVEPFPSPGIRHSLLLLQIQENVPVPVHHIEGHYGN